MSTLPPVPPEPPTPPVPPHAPAPPPSDVIEPPASPMEPVLVLIAAVFLGPIAYFLYGQWQKALGAIGLYVVLALLNLMLCFALWFVFAPLHAVVIVDSFMQARRLQERRAIRHWTFFNQEA
jgi:hypothetical protein